MDSSGIALECVCEGACAVRRALRCGHSFRSGRMIPEQEQGFWTVAHIRGNTCMELASRFPEILGALSGAGRRGGSPAVAALSFARTCFSNRCCPFSGNMFVIRGVWDLPL